MKYILFIGFVLILVSCNTKKKMAKRSSIENLGQKKYGNAISLLYNESKTYVVVQHKKKMSNNTRFPTIEFTIYNAKSQEVLKTDIVPGGEIVWISDTVLEVRSLVGRPRPGQEGKKVKYRYDVSKNQKQF